MSYAAVAEAAELLAEQGVITRLVSLRLLAPLQTAALGAALEGCEQIVVIEQNHGKQLFHYLRGQLDFDAPVHSYAMAGPVPLAAENIVQAVVGVLN